MRSSLAGLILLPLAACAPLAPASDTLPDPVPPLASLQGNPQLALLEEVLRGYFAADIADRPTICAALHDGREEAALPPEDERALMERFPTLAPMSRCAVSAGRWVDGENGEAALVFAVDSLTCATATACTARAGYRNGAAAALSARYTMDYAQGRWRFAREGQ